MELENFPEDVIEHYTLRDSEKDDKVYVEISKGMYGLLQAGIIAQELLEKRLLKHGYLQIESTHTRIVDPQMKANLLFINCG